MGVIVVVVVVVVVPAVVAGNNVGLMGIGQEEVGLEVSQSYQEAKLFQDSLFSYGP